MTMVVVMMREAEGTGTGSVFSIGVLDVVPEQKQCHLTHRIGCNFWLKVLHAERLAFAITADAGSLG